MRRLLALGAAAALFLTLAGWESTQAQNEPAVCPEPTNLGELTDVLSVGGEWTPESRAQCGTSQFLDNRPGVRFRFTLAEEAEVRIDLTSADRDALVYLQTDDGTLIDSDDDTGGEGDARIERTLSAGAYGIEASALGWSGRESGSFELTLRLVSGCHDVVELGLLVETLGADGAWSHFGCESEFRPDRSSRRYRFTLDQTTRVRIDLTSTLADPYVYLLDNAGTLLESDDDSGVRFNSRIVRVLGVGSYIIEATNWGDRDLKNLLEADYGLEISRAEDGPIIKLEAIEAPDRVVLGLPFEIHYRVGNLGETALSTINGSVQVRLRWPYVSNWRTALIGTSDGDSELWGVGASYHSDDSIAAFASQPLTQLQSLEGAFRWRVGPTDVLLDVVVLNEDNDNISSHRLSRPVIVLSGIEFDQVQVSVDDVDYQVSAIANAEGKVTTEVSPVATEEDESASAEDETTDDLTAEESAEEPAEEPAALDPGISSRAIYAAGVRTQVLDDFGAAVESLREQVDSLYARVARGGLPLFEVVPAAAPTQDALVETLHAAHSETLDHAAFDPQQFQSVDAAEEIVVRAGRSAARRIEQFIRAWDDLLAPDRVISASEALRVQSQLAFAQRVDSRLVEAAVIVLIKRDVPDGWNDPQVAMLLADFGGGIDCGVDASALAFADRALRELSQIYGLMLDLAYCGAVAAGNDHDLLLTGLDLATNPTIPVAEVSDDPPMAPVVSASRLLARVLEDGRVEFGVELTSGERALPNQRHLPVSAMADRWLRTGSIIDDGEELGRVYARRLGNGMVQATYVPTDVSMDSTSRWVVPEDAPVNTWLVTGALELGPLASGDDLVQRVADKAAGAGSAQFGDHLSLLALIENNLQRNP